MVRSFASDDASSESIRQSIRVAKLTDASACMRHRLALAYSGLVATWAIMSSHVAQIQARGRCSTSRCSGIVNSAGIVLIVAYTLLLVPPAVVVGRLYAQLIDDLDAVVALLSELSRSWERGPPDLSSALPALQNIARVAIEYFRQLQIMFCVFAASSLLLAIVSGDHLFETEPRR